MQHAQATGSQKAKQNKSTHAHGGAETDLARKQIRPDWEFYQDRGKPLVLEGQIIIGVKTYCF